MVSPAAAPSISQDSNVENDINRSELQAESAGAYFLAELSEELSG